MRNFSRSRCIHRCKLLIYLCLTSKVNICVQTGGVYFQICVGNFGYYCHLLPGFSVKFAHQNFTDACYIWGHCSRQINIKIRNPSHGFLVVIVKVFRSNFKAVRFSIYPNNMFKEDTHKNCIVQWVAKVSACSTYFWIFPIALPHLNVSWCYKMVTNFRQYFFFGGGGGGRWDLPVTY